jgi:DnaJ-class molecular chaperone
MIEKECVCCSGSGYYCGGKCGACNGTGLEHSKDDIIEDLKKEIIALKKELNCYREREKFTLQMNAGTLDHQCY